MEFRWHSTPPVKLSDGADPVSRETFGTKQGDRMNDFTVQNIWQIGTRVFFGEDFVKVHDFEKEAYEFFSRHVGDPITGITVDSLAADDRSLDGDLSRSRIADSASQLLGVL